MSSLTELLDRVPVEDITTTAKRITPGRAIAATLGGLLFCIGWVLAKLVIVLWFGLKWMFAAALVGWKTARHEALLQPDPVALLRENEFLRAELARLGG